MEQIAGSDTTVLVLGETGTGKELVARTIHGLSPRKNRALVKVNCAALPSNLIESELFGHEKGAFTGSDSRHLGRFEVANGATLFLNEIGELPLELQPKLLRVLQDGEFERLGKTIEMIPASVMNALQDYHWPGNVRELENVLERTVINLSGPKLRLADELKKPFNGSNTSPKTLEVVSATTLSRHWNKPTGKSAEKTALPKSLGSTAAPCAHVCVYFPELSYFCFRDQAAPCAHVCVYLASKKHKFLSHQTSPDTQVFSRSICPFHLLPITPKRL